MKLHLIILSVATISVPAWAQVALQDCSRIVDDRARLACFDTAINPVLEPTGPDNVAVYPSQPSIESSPIAPILPTEDRAPAKLSQQDDFGIEMQVIETTSTDATRTFTVAAATHNEFTGWTIQFSNGQVWRQIGADNFRIVAGQDYAITRGVLNSFMLGEPGGRRKIRVSRME